MSNNILPGYMGHCVISGTKIRINSASVNPIQDYLFYDHTIGLRDSIPTGIRNPKTDAGRLNKQKQIYRQSTILYQGGITFPLCDGDLSTIFEMAKCGNDGDVEIKYACNEFSRIYEDSKINSLTISCVAGDVVNVALDIMAPLLREGSYSKYTQVKKMITWDAVSLPDFDEVQGFSLTITNNCKAIYTADSLSPLEIRVGMQEITGSIDIYGMDNSMANEQDFSITIDGYTITVKALFKPSLIESKVGPIVTSLPFVGRGKALGD
jgi:hypothetical protein